MCAISRGATLITCKLYRLNCKVFLQRRLFFLLFFLFLFGCNSESELNSQIEIRSPIDDPVNLTWEEATEIAFLQTEKDGLGSPILWSHEGHLKIQIEYSPVYERDMKVYAVYLKTTSRPDTSFYNVAYYISTENGEIVKSLNN